MPFIERYWAAADPDYCDGEGAESFNDLLSRVEAALRRLEGFPEEALVYLFSHGQFIQATRSVHNETWTDDGRADAGLLETGGRRDRKC